MEGKCCKPRLAYAILFTHDMKAETAFFRDVIGWKPHNETEHWTEICTNSETVVALHSTEEKDGLDGHFHFGNGNISIFVDDIQAFHEKMNKHKVKVVENPEKKEWGGIYASYLSPSHHRISVVQCNGCHAACGQSKGNAGQANGNGHKASNPSEAKFAYFVSITDKPKDAAHWYQEHFGWKIVGNEFTQWVELDCGSSTKVAMHEGLSSDDKLRVHVPGHGAMGLFVDNLDEFHNKIKQLEGVTVLSEPKKEFWGGKNAGYRIPCGNVLSVTEAKGYPKDIHFRKLEEKS